MKHEKHTFRKFWSGKITLCAKLHGIVLQLAGAFPAFPFASFEILPYNLTVWILDSLNIEFGFCIRAFRHIFLGPLFCVFVWLGSPRFVKLPELYTSGDHCFCRMANRTMANEIIAHTHSPGDTVHLRRERRRNWRNTWFFHPQITLSCWCYLTLANVLQYTWHPKPCFRTLNNISCQNKLSSDTWCGFKTYWHISYVFFDRQPCMLACRSSFESKRNHLVRPKYAMLWKR